MQNTDKYHGCLVGGAAGDALGYAVEFLDVRRIFLTFGQLGITQYDLIDGVAQVSDDTQMTLFTANGLLCGAAVGGGERVYLDALARCYQDWLQTQTLSEPPKDKAPSAWLARLPALYCRRAPGNTCLSAIKRGANGTMAAPINQSKGCCGVMRAAPIGLFFSGEGDLSCDCADILGAASAALTHGHPLGWLPAAAFAHIVRLLAHGKDTPVAFAAKDAMNALTRLFPGNDYTNVLLSLLKKAMDLATQNGNDLQAIVSLGEGWVADEALAIALYCALKYEHDFDRALIAAVNHNGDSDSTGAITGNILGARLGLSGIPQKYVDNLELLPLLLEMADDLARGADHSETFAQKYVTATFTMEV